MCYSAQRERIRQAAEPSKKAKKKSNKPVKIAPTTLVAAKVTPKRMTANNAVPKAPTNKPERALQLQPSLH